MRISRTILAGVLALTLSTLSACAAPDSGKTGNDTTVKSGGKDAAAAGLLPDNIASSGTLKIATSAPFPPMEEISADGKTFTGFDIDLGNALGEILGVKVEWTNADFDGLIGNIDSGRQDMVMASMVDKAERQAKLTFVDYLNSGFVYIVKSDVAGDYTDLTSLCGKKVAVEKGSYGVTAAENASKDCESSGKPALDVSVLPKMADAVTAINSGRADASIALDLTMVDTVAKSNGTLTIIGTPFDTVPLGVGIAKANEDLVKAVQAALKKFQADGGYAELLKKYSLSDNALDGAPLNQGK